MNEPENEQLMRSISEMTPFGQKQTTETTEREKGYEQRASEAFLSLSALFVPIVAVLIFVRLRENVAAPFLPLFVPVVCLIGAYLARKGYTLQAVLLLFAPLSLALLRLNLQVSNLSFLTVVILGIATFGLITEAIPPKHIQKTAVILASIGTVFILVDQFGSPTRIRFSENSLTLLTITTILGFLIALFLILRRFNAYSLRAKLVIATIFMAIVAIGANISIVTWVTRNTLKAELGREFRTLAETKAIGVSELIAREVNLLRVLSFNTVIRAEAIQKNDQYTGDEADIFIALTELDQAWESIPDEDPFVASTQNNPATDTLETFVNQFPSNLEILVTDRYGGLIAATARTQDYYYANAPWWQIAYNDGLGNTFIGSPADNNDDQASITVALPIYNESKTDVLGIIHANYALDEILTLLSQTEELGQTGHIDLLVGREVLSGGDRETHQEVAGLFTSSDISFADLREGLTTYAEEELDGTPNLVSIVPVTTLGHVPPVDELGWSIFVHQPVSEVFTTVENQQQAYILIGIGIIFVGGIAAANVGKGVTAPIIKLMETSTKVAAGNFNLRTKVDTRDEIGQLALSFNSMTEQIQENLRTLDKRVMERTRALEASARVSRSISMILDRDQLVSEVVNQTRQAFNYYHVHIYLLNQAHHRLDIVGGTGEVGQQLLAQGHCLDIGEGLVGWAANTNAAVLVPDISQDPNWKPNPLLPNTRAELAVPISVGETVLGVLDVQDTDVGGLTQRDVDLVQAIANQVAIALQNADSYERAQRNIIRETLLNDITQKIQETADIESALRVATLELGLALNGAKTAVRLVPGQAQNDQAS